MLGRRSWSSSGIDSRVKALFSLLRFCADSLPTLKYRLPIYWSICQFKKLVFVEKTLFHPVNARKVSVISVFLNENLPLFSQK